MLDFTVPPANFLCRGFRFHYGVRIAFPREEDLVAVVAEYDRLSVIRFDEWESPDINDPVWTKSVGSLGEAIAEAQLIPVDFYTDENWLKLMGFEVTGSGLFY